MREIMLFVAVGILLIAGTLANGYEVKYDSTAFRVALWQDGKPQTEKLFSGKWSDLKDGKADYPDFSVEVSRSGTANDMDYRIKVSPKGNWGVAEVDFPMLYLPRLSNDYIIEAVRIGQRIPVDKYKADSLCELAGRPEYQQYPDVRNKRSIVFLRYPARNTLQLMMYENENEGVMIWTPDSELYPKDFVIARDDMDLQLRGKGLRAYVVNFPERTGQPGVGYSSPYPVKVTSYKGGWPQAAKIYREWGTKQWWCNKGKIADRRETPEWFRNLSVTWGVAGKSAWVTQNADAVLPYLQDSVCLSQLMNWGFFFNDNMVSTPQYMPAAEEKFFRRNVSLTSRNLHLAPYFMFSVVVREYPPVFDALKDSRALFPDGSPSSVHGHELDYKLILEKKKEVPTEIMDLCKQFAQWMEEVKKSWNGPVNEELIARLDTMIKAPALLDRQKKILRSNWGKDIAALNQVKYHPCHDRLCLHSKTAFDFCLNQLVSCADKYGVSGIYLDTFPLSIVPCYDARHGHEVGYGRYLVTDSRDLLKAFHQKYPNKISISESGAGELVLDMDHMTYFKGLKPEYAIPLFPQVYNGYIKWTCWWMWPPYVNDESFTSNMAISTHLGYLPGSAIIGGVLTQFARQLKPSADDRKLKYFQECIQIIQKYRDYIADGDRLPDPEVQGASLQNVTWTVSHNTNYASQLKIKPVLASLWLKYKSADQGLLLMSNWTAKEQQATVFGKKYAFAPYQWQAVELKITNEMLNSGELSVVTGVGDGVPLPKTVVQKVPPVSSGLNYAGKITAINLNGQNITVEYPGADKNVATKKGTFRFAKGTEPLNFTSIKDLKIGDTIEFTATESAKIGKITKSGAGAKQAGNAKIDIASSGIKPEPSQELRTATASAELMRGQIISVQAGVVTIEYQRMENGAQVVKMGTFKVAKRTKTANFNAIKELKPGDIVEFSASESGKLETITLDLKGDKAEQG